MTQPSDNTALAVPRRTRLSESCFEAIVAAADLVYESPRGSHDYAGSDYTVKIPTAIVPDGREVLSAQLKSTSVDSTNFRRTRNGLSYDLDAATYDRLVIRRSFPIVLVLVVFPHADRWLTVEDDKVILMCTAYLINLEGQPPSGNSSTKVVKFNADDRLEPDLLWSFIDSRRLTNQ